MSWSNFSFDIFTPALSGTLTTQYLVIDQLSVNNVIGTCNTNCQCDPDPPICSKDGNPLCIPTFENTCGSGRTLFSSSNETPVRLSYSDNGCPKCCSGGVCKAQSNYASCQITQDQYCGNFNGKSTCTLGTYAIGNCKDQNCLYGTNWSQATGSTPSSIPTGSVPIPSSISGWVICEYLFDYSSLWQATFNQLGNFVQDIISGKTSPSAPNGIDKSVRPRVGDANLVYGCIYEFYNRLFNTGYYASNPTMNPLQDTDFISDGFSDTLFDIVQNLENLIYVNSNTPSSLDTSIRSSLIPPKPIQNGDSYQLSVQLSYSQYQEYLASGNPNGYIQNCINSFLKDSQGQMTQNNINIPINPLVFTNASVTSFSAIQLQDLNGNPAYSYKTGIDPTTFTSANYPNYIFATAQVIVTIESWSPMLLIYCVNILPTITFSPTACSQIAVQVNTIPLKCYDTCSSEGGGSCLQYIEKFCSINYQPPSQFSSALVDDSLFSLNASDCLCYNSYLTPAGQGFQQGVPASMCFDSHCTTQFRSLFGLNDQNCPQYCEQVYDWYNGQGQNKSRRPDFLDQIRFGQLCGEVPTMEPDQFNASVLITGIITTILGGLLTFSISKHLNHSSTKTGVLVIISIIILGFLTGFFSRDLAGISKGCSGDAPPYKFVCQSRITQIDLPNQFCNFQEACECIGKAGDCPGGCTCASTVCLPPSGQRPYTTVKKRRPNPVMITLGCIIGVIMPGILIYLHEDYHWPISKGKFSMIMIVLGLICIGYTIYNALKKYDDIVFDGACSGTGPPATGCNPPCPTGYQCNNITNQCDCIKNPCNNRQCGWDGCGNPCGGDGNCPTGYSCKEGNCVGQSSFEIGYTDSKGITYNLGVMVNSGGTISPETLFLYPTQQILANPNGFYTNWTYNPETYILYMTPSAVTNQEVYALTSNAPLQRICDPYPTTQNPGTNPNMSNTSDYPMYVDVYVPGSLKDRFERWDIHTDGRICDLACQDNTQGLPRCIGAYALQDTNGNPLSSILSITTTSPWNLECATFTFNPEPPPGVFSSTPSCNSVLVCNDRTGVTAGCPQISTTTGNGSGTAHVVNCSGLKVISQPNPNIGSVENQIGLNICGVSPYNQQYQDGCCTYIGDACFDTAMNTWCNQLAFPYQ